MSRGMPVSPIAMLRSVHLHRELIWSLVKRDFVGRYKGSALGVLWSLLVPLLMLGIYTFVFSVVFKARWGAGNEDKSTFAVVLFAGMIVHGFFAECLNRAPMLITGHVNYVKKVVFPLEILAWMVLGSALLHFLVSFIVLLLAALAVGVSVHAAVLWVPVLLLPLVMTVLGLSWLLGSLGVYLRDLSQLVGMLTTVALFLSPVFYPIDSLPPAYRSLLVWNPITLPILQIRDVLVWNLPVQWSTWGLSLLVGLALSFAGFWWFQKSRQGFADVL